VELSAADKDAWDLYWKIRRLGADLVFALEPRRLTEYEAGELLHRLAVIAGFVEAREQEAERERLAALMKRQA